MKAPHNDKDWSNVRREAIVLIEAMNLVTMPGRHMAQPGTKSDNPASELEPDQIEALVTQDRPAFTKFAFTLQDTAIAALKAIDAKDTEALSNAAGTSTWRARAATPSTGIRTRRRASACARRASTT